MQASWAALQPVALGSGGYVNGATDQDEGQVHDTFGETKYARLARIKAAYDSGDVFRRGLRFRPA